MRQYVITPIANLELMDQGDDIFALAHLWLKYPVYREYILKKKAEGKFITLDNSAAERSLVTEDALIEICKELMPNEVIAPDVLFDSMQTIENLNSFIKRMNDERLLGKIDIFFCPQGRTRAEWLDCYNYGLQNQWVNVIGFSKIAVPMAWLGVGDDKGIKEARHSAYNYLKVHDLLQKPIHCLGQGDPREFDYYDHPMMRSSDSVYPVLAANVGISFREKQFDRVPTPHDYLEVGNLTIDQVMIAKSNIRVAHSIMHKSSK